MKPSKNTSRVSGGRQDRVPQSPASTSPRTCNRKEKLKEKEVEESPKRIKIPGIRKMASKEKKGEAPPARDEGAPRSAPAPAPVPPSHPPELPRPIAEGEIRINVGQSEIQPAEDPITDSGITEENPRLNLWPHPESFSSGSDSSPKCGSCSFITDFFSDYCCKIL